MEQPREKFFPGDIVLRGDKDYFRVIKVIRTSPRDIFYGIKRVGTELNSIVSENELKPYENKQRYEII